MKLAKGEKVRVYIDEKICGIGVLQIKYVSFHKVISKMEE